MFGWLRRWWQAWGERQCARDKHAWDPCGPPVDQMGTGEMFLAHYTMSFYYAWGRCIRCGKLGRKLR